MTTRSAGIAVVGGGLAGVAAAWAARRAGVEVTVFHAAPGATALSSGAVHRAAPGRPSQTSEPNDELSAFVEALGLWAMPPAGALIATQSGVVLPAEGHDRALLDLRLVEGRSILLPSGGPLAWDGLGLAAALAASPWARATRTTFRAVSVAGPGAWSDVWAGVAPHAAAVALARHAERAGAVDALAAALGEAASSAEGWLLGPWLGESKSLADELGVLLGVPVGETTSLPGETAGFRLERATRALTERIGARRERALVTAVADGARDVRLTCGETERVFGAVSLAMGGPLAGGVTLAGSGDGRAFCLGLAAPGVELALDGEPAERCSSRLGPDFVELGLGALERVGVVLEGARARGTERLFAAGELVAARPRTVLAAVESGLAAGRAAARRATAS